MITIISTGNYVIFVEDSKELINRSKSKVEIEKLASGKYNVVVNNNIIIHAKPFDEFSPDGMSPFETAQDFEDFYMVNTGVSFLAVTDFDLIESPLPIIVTNPIDNRTDRVIVGEITMNSSTATLINASTPERKKIIIQNKDTHKVYVKFGATASSSSYTYCLGQYDFIVETDYTGLITGISASDTPKLAVTVF